MPNSTQLFVLVAGVVAVVLIVGLLVARGRRRHAELVERFGPEYERAVEEHGSRALAERELVDREKRVGGLRLHPLSERDRRSLTVRWNQVQAYFFDDPAGAVEKAEAVIKAAMQARGYAQEHFEQRLADLSVEHAGVVQHYRAARELVSANRAHRPDVDELRQAIVHYRALFVDLLAEPEAAGRVLWQGRVAHSRP
jgi:hypothetical protein